MARAKKLVKSDELDIAIYQDDMDLYAVHFSCGPRAQFLRDAIFEWYCNTCESIWITVGGATPAPRASEIRVGPRRKTSEVQKFAAEWLGVPEARVEVDIKR